MGTAYSSMAKMRKVRFMKKVGEEQILEMSVIMLFENLISHLFSKMLKIRIYKIVPFIDVKSGFFEGRT
jgi:hypothetical protein